MSYAKKMSSQDIESVLAFMKEDFSSEEKSKARKTEQLNKLLMHASENIPFYLNKYSKSCDYPVLSKLDLLSAYHEYCANGAGLVEDVHARVIDTV